jgi:MinD-like ATPase involved in chromosome partitioning or flagellar assembly
MDNDKGSYLRFIGLRLNDYRAFGGVNDLWFNRYRTIIVGKGGTGKTVITEALEHLGGPAVAEQPLTLYGRSASSVVVVTEGNCGLIDRYRSFILLNDRSAERLTAYRHDHKFKSIVPDGLRNAIENQARTNFEAMLRYKPWKVGMHRDLNVQVMAAGEKTCLCYAFVFAVREALKLDVPIVIDSPYSRLDQELRNGVRSFLKTQPCQQILLGHECEFIKEDHPKYILIYVDKYSKVMEF